MALNPEQRIADTKECKGDSEQVVIIRSFNQRDVDACKAVLRDGLGQAWLSDLDDSVAMFLTSACLLTLFSVYIWSYWVFKSFLVLLSVAAMAYHVYRCHLIELTFEEHIAKELGNVSRDYMDKESCHIWVAETRGKVIGMASLAHTEQHKASETQITAFGVLMSYRKRGISKRLLTELVKFAIDRDFEKVFVYTSSYPAMAVLADCGFDITGEVVRYSRFGEYFNDFRDYRMELDF